MLHFAEKALGRSATRDLLAVLLPFNHRLHEKRRIEKTPHQVTKPQS